MTDLDQDQGLRWVWPAALGMFVVAGLTGVLYRMGITYGWTAGLSLVNVRHAHSHLMYFGWVTPLLFALVARGMARASGRPLPRHLNWILAGCFGAAALSYSLFLAYGYTPVAVGLRRLPISVIGSTLNMFSWYAFAAWYARASKGVTRTHAVTMWDAAVVFMVLSTFGAFALALLKPLGIHDPAWISALTHVFLDYFSEGWFVLAVLGLMFMEIDRHRNAHWSLYALCAGVPVTFALGMPSLLVPQELKLVGSFGGALLGAGLLANIVLLWQPAVRQGGWLWGIPLALLALKASGQLAGSVVPGVWWADMHGMRILYLHLMLLGFVTLGLAASAGAAWGRSAAVGGGLFFAAVCLVLVTLVPMSNLWPAAWGGRWSYVLAAWFSPLPAAAATAMLARSVRAGRRLAALGHEARTVPAAPVRGVHGAV